MKKLLGSFLFLGFLVAADAHRFTAPECKAVATTLYLIAKDRDRGESKADQIKEADTHLPECHKRYQATCALKDSGDDAMVYAMIDFIYSDKGKGLTPEEFAQAAYASCLSAAPKDDEHQMRYGY